MAGPSLIPSGDFRTSYAADTMIFPTTTSRNAAIIGLVLVCFAPMVFANFWLSIAIQIDSGERCSGNATMPNPIATSATPMMDIHISHLHPLE